MGRKRTKDLQLLPGVRLIGGRLYWQPTSELERDERRAKGLKVSERLGAAVRVRGRVEMTKAQRASWSALKGYRDEEAEEGTVGELVLLWKRDGLKLKPNGKPRAKGTIKSYTNAVPVILATFRATRYGRSSREAADGKAIGPADIQRFVKTCPSKAIGNICLAVLSNAFGHGIAQGLTIYNPCEPVVKNGMEPRKRAPAPWEFECLQTLAKLREHLILEFVRVTGDRISEILAVLRAHGTADGIDITRKGDKVETWRWSERLRWIWTEALKLKGATPFAKSPLFPGRRGKPFTYSGFNTAWQALKEKTNAALAGGVVDPDSLEVQPGLVIADMHFHDLRSKTHDDAVDKGRSGAEQIGDTLQVATVHYARRPAKKVPLE